MPFDGSGTFARLRSWINDAAAGIKIKSDFHDQNDDDIAAGLTNCLTKDGQSQPTNHIGMNGHKLVNLADPTNDSDAANKKYVDALKAFSKGLEISGADNFGRLGFTSTTGVNGLSFTGADLGWFARLADATATPAKLNRLVLNDKPDGSGADVITANDDGSFVANRSVSAPELDVKPTAGAGKVVFYAADGTERMTIAIDSGVQADATITVGDKVVTLGKDGTLKAQGAIYAGGAVYAGANAWIDGSANLNGNNTVWRQQWGGANDAFNAINGRIESRAQAWANDRVSQLQYRRTALGAAGMPGWGTFDLPAGTVCTGTTVDNYKWQTMRYMYLQVFDPVRGWVGFQG